MSRKKCGLLEHSGLSVATNIAVILYPITKSDVSFIVLALVPFCCVTLLPFAEV